MGPRVIVVCNDNDLAITMQQALISAGFSVLVAGNAPDAIDRIAVNKPELIIVDMMLPRIGGIALLQTLRKNMTTREIPVILTTANTSSQSRLEALESGADAFMSKPFSDRDLVRLVTEFLPSQSRYLARQ